MRSIGCLLKGSGNVLGAESVYRQVSESGSRFSHTVITAVFAFGMGGGNPATGVSTSAQCARNFRFMMSCEIPVVYFTPH